MSEDTSPIEEVSEKATQHESNKVCREGLAFAHHKLQYTPHIMEECTHFHNSVAILTAMCKDLQSKIELIEPPVKVEPKKSAPYIVEVPSPEPAA